MYMYVCMHIYIYIYINTHYHFSSWTRSPQVKRDYDQNKVQTIQYAAGLDHY